MIEASSGNAVVLEGDCLDRLREMEAESVDALVTDPPAGISFMNAKWDSDKGSRNQWIAWLTEVMEEALRVMKPGAHGLVWALPRTSHWTAMALEDAGFEVRDRIAHHFGSGFPKSANVSKLIDKMAGRIGKNTLTIKQELRAHFEDSGLTLQGLNRQCGFEASGYLRTSSTWAGVLPDEQKWRVMRHVLKCGPHLDDVFKAATREVVGKGTSGETAIWAEGGMGDFDLTTDATDEAKRWSGWGTALKPATEDWWLVRKPLSEKSVARQVLSTGTGALNIAASRVQASGQDDGVARSRKSPMGYHGSAGEMHEAPGESGRWPANLLLSHSEFCVPVGERRVKSQSGSSTPGNGDKTFCGANLGNRSDIPIYADPEGYETVQAWECARDDEGNFVCPVALMDLQSGTSTGGYRANPSATSEVGRVALGAFENGHVRGERGYKDQGGASRFFQCFHSDTGPDTGAGFIYAAKASRRERNAGLEGMPEQTVQTGCAGDMPIDDNGKERDRFKKTAANTHPTVKPLALMRYLSKMVCREGGTILDPFAGSGSTGVACIQTGMNFVGIEQNEEYAEIARRRISHAQGEAQLQTAPSRPAGKPTPPPDDKKDTESVDSLLDLLDADSATV